ncbi:MAG: family 20 glycosylhydrolase [Clostridia bacterium]
MNLLPQPKQCIFGKGHTTLTYRTQIVLQNTAPLSLLHAQMLQKSICEGTGLQLSILRGKPLAGDLALVKDASLAQNTYQLSVKQEGITLCAGGDEALLNGVQTLCQLVLRHGAKLPLLQITDWPDLAHRGYYLDVSRGRVPTLDALKRYADLLCRYKINEWQLYIEHTYLFRDLSEAWRDETPLTAENIMELDAYCAARCIELVPSLSTFGHMYKILSTKTHCDLCELENAEKVPFSYTYAGEHHTLNVSNSGSLPFIKGLIREYMALFTSKKFNICADETFDLGKGRSQGLAQEQGERALYLRHVQALCEFLVAEGHTPMFWGDIMWRFPEACTQLPKETICLNWGYLPNQREDEIRMLAEAGATQYACPGVCTWNRWFPLFQSAYSNIACMCAHAKKYACIGLLNTDWGDYGHIDHPWFSVPAIIYGAAFAWNAQPAPFEELNQAISFLEYGDSSERFMEAFTALSENEVFLWRNAVLWMEEPNPEKQSEWLAELDFSKVPSANQALSDALCAAQEAALCMPPAKREIIQALAVAADGVRLWNEIGLYIAVHFAKQAFCAKEGAVLAAELEGWYAAYLRLWRQSSREGGVSKTMKLITDYADMLRGREHAK